MDYQAAAPPQEGEVAGGSHTKEEEQAAPAEVTPSNDQNSAAPVVEQAQQQENAQQDEARENVEQQQQSQPQLVGVEHQLSQVPELHHGAQALDPGMAGVLHHFDSSLVGAPPGLSPLQHPQELDANGKFRPIDLESLSPKSRQRVMRNRQAATRSKAKKKEQYQLLKDRKVALAIEMEQMEAQLAAAQQRVAQMHTDNKILLDACKCPKEYPKE